MTLRKRPALTILAGQAHAMAFVDQRSEGKRLTQCPIDSLAALDRLAAIIEEALDRLVHIEIVGNFIETQPDFFEPFEIGAGLAATCLFGLVCRPQSSP